MPDQAGTERQTAEIADCFFELIGRIVAQAEQLAQGLGIPAPFIKALHTLDCPMAMKDLGKRMHCDPSFVTLLTDMLEKRGLARREAHPADRRIKNVVLTDQGLALKHKVEAEITARMPWNVALSDDERSQLLTLVRKMIAATGGSATTKAAEDAINGKLTSLLASALEKHPERADPASPAPGLTSLPADPNSPPASTGEVSDDVSEPSVAS